MSDKQLLKRLASLSPEQRELLLKQLQKKKSKSVQPKVDAIQPYPRESNYLPMSYAQQRLWFLDQLQSGSASYNISAALRLSGNLDVEALRLAFEEIVARHESLRTTFVNENGHGRQVINDPQRWELPTISLEPLNREEQEEVLRTRFRGDAHSSFDLINGPLLRTRLIRLALDHHILIVTMHHIVADGWSMGVLINEVATLYTAFLDDKGSPLPPLRIQYADYAQWQREYLTGERLDRQLTYWVERLRDVPVLELPTDFPRPPIQSYEGANLPFSLSAELSQEINNLCRSQGVTLFMALLAILQVLLHRYSGQDDICVGTPIANRVRPELEGLIGCFVNTLAIRSQMDGSVSFTSLLKQVQANLTGAYDHQDIPFERLVDELGLAREMSHSPLFQVMFVLQNATQGTRLELPGLNIELLPEESRTSKFDLTINLREENGQIKGDWEYRTDLFRRDTIERMMEHFLALIRSVTVNPSAAIDELNLLSDNERNKLLLEWNATTRPYERDDTIADRFVAQVAATPDKAAVVFEDQALSYRELDQWANTLARQLIDRGVQPGQRVGLCADRSLALVAGIFGILKAGAAFVPLDPAYPQDRLHYMLEDTGAEWVLVHQHLRERLPVSDEAALILDDLVSDASVAAICVKVPPRSPAYVMYTSGSTGKPKGIEVVQRNVVRLVRNTNFMTLDDSVVFLQYAPVSFDAATLEIFGPLLNGGTLAVCPPGQLDAQQLGDVIQRHGVNAAWITAALFHFIAEYHLDSLSGVRQLLAGGDVLAPNLVRKVLSRFDGITLINGYGPTENTTFTCCFPMHHVDDVRHTVPIGRPIANTRIYILDKQLNPVPTGVPGELYTSGDGVANGYLNRDELTRQVFVNNPFNTVDDPVMYKTGDLVRYHTDGVVEYIGRIDQQVKIRGYRIELGEIETALSRINTVRENAVIAREDVPGVKRLVGYVVPVEGEQPSSGELKAELKQTLPDYMVPSAFVMMERFPVTANGKLDRKALPRPEEEQADTASRVAPRNPRERILAEIWQDLLNVEQVGVYDNFFELGGDSILSIQITSRAKQQGLHLTTKQIFENQTIAELADVASDVETPVLAEQGLVMGTVRLAPIEQWFFDHKFKSPHHWNQSVLLALKTDANLTVQQLRDALSVVVLQHDALRLRFHPEDQGIHQFHHDDPEGSSHFNLRDIDLSGVDPAEVNDQLSTEAERVQASLDLARGPLVAAARIVLPDQQQRLLLVIHHLVVDGVSWRVLLEDFTQALAQLRESGKAMLPAKTTSYKQWVEALCEHVSAGQFNDQIPFWRDAIEQGKAPLPVDHPQGSNAVAFQQVISVSLDGSKTAQLLREVPKAYKTEINDVLLTALARTLANWTGHSGSLIDLEGHGRESFSEQIDLSRTVGWFTSVYPVRLCYDSGLPIDANLKRVKEYLRNIPQRGFGFGALKYLSSDELLRKRLASAPKADVVFNYLGQFDGMLDNNPWFSLANENKGSEHSLDSEETHLLSINSHVVQGRLVVEWIFSQQKYDSDTIQRVALEYQDNLIKLIDYCLDPKTFGYTPSDFPLSGLDQASIDRLFGKIASLESVYPLSPMQEGMLFHSLFDTSSGVYFEQLSVEVIGDIDRDKLYEAWNFVINRHPVLRSAFLWQDLDRPLQVVYSQIDSEVSEFDWRELTDEQLLHRYPQWLEQDRKRGFDFEKPGLTRLAWIDMPENRSRLVWSFHHVVLDGWSLPLIMGEIFQTYTALAQGQMPQLAPAGKYEDFIAWLQQIDKADALQFWKSYLHGFQAPTPLAGQKTAPREDATKEYHEVDWVLDVHQTQQLQQFAREQHITLNTVVQAAWGILLSIYSGEQDVVFGTTVSGRPAELSGVENIVGLFINTLPLRVHLSDDTRIQPLLQSMQEEQLDLRRFEATPLVDIHHHSEVPGDQSMFDSILVFENYPVGEAVKSGDQLLDISQVTSIEHTNYPLTLIVEPGERLHFKLSYNSALFERQSVSHMLAHLGNLFKAILTRPEMPVRRYPLLTSEEHEQLLNEWNPAPADYSRELCLHEMFEQQVRNAPDQIAVSFGSQQMSYAQLNQRANRLARILLAKGVTSERFVALGLDRSIDMVVAMVAVLKAGGAYVPLDPGYPEERLTFMLQDTQAPVLVTRKAFANVLLPIAKAVGGELETVLLDGDAAYIDEQFDNNLDQPIFGDPRRLAYVVYTSGSTGKPKGVVCTQLAVTRLVRESNYVTVTPEDKVAHLSNVSFDASTFEIWGALLNGATLVGFDQNTVLNPEAFAAHCAEHDVNIMFITTALFNVFAIHQPQLFKQMKYLMFGGEACDPQQVRKIAEGYKPTHFLHVYGPSENTTFSTWYDIQNVPGGALTVPIGRSISGSTAYILDKFLQPVPPGISGEIYVGGDGLATGYLHDPEKTEQSFVPNPFEANTLLYKTGDLARWTLDGQIEILGRADDQVKIRGFRIELGEVEASLTRLSMVREAVVVVREDQPGQKRLVAYVQGDEGIDAALLRREAAKQLPKHMVPAAFVVMEQFPLTQNGKINKRALPEPSAEASAAQEFVAPRNERERVLAEVWAQVLKADTIGIHDNFFELGGDSILSIQIISRAKRAGLQLSAKQVFEYQTIAELAEVVTDLSTLIVAEQGLVEGEAMLTPVQQWFFNQQIADQHHYNQSLMLRVDGSVTKLQLQEAWQGVLWQHDALRLLYHHDATGWHQTFRQSEHIETLLAQVFEAVDLSGLPDDARAEQIETLADQFQQEMNLEKGPLIRVVHFHLGEGEASRLLVIIHHLVVDVFSWRVLMEDLQSALQAIQSGNAVALGSKTTSFQQWGDALLDFVRSGQLARDCEYWKGLLEKPANELPADLQGRNTVSSVQVIEDALPAVQTEQLLTRTASAYHTEINELLLTALARALRDWQGEAGVLIDMEGHGREAIADSIDVSRTVGWFTSIFPQYLLLPEGDALDQHIKSIKEQVRNVPMKGMSYGLLRYLSDDDELKQRLAGTQKAQLSFNYLGQLDQTLDAEGLLAQADEKTGAEISAAGERAYWLEVSARVQQGQLKTAWRYSAAIHHEKTVRNLAQSFLGHLQAVITHCSDPANGGYTPADFPLSGLDQAHIDSLLPRKGIEAVYPLSPVQEGMLFHSLYEPDSWVYFDQVSVNLGGDVQEELLFDAWRNIVRRHAILRTGFIWEGVARPLQVVHTDIDLPITRFDWSDLDEPQVAAKLERLLIDDRNLGFNFRQAGILRLTWIKLPKQRYQLVWSFHHILLDGWSMPVVFQELFASYEALVQQDQLALPRAPRYQDFIAWMLNRDARATEQFWQRYLEGFSAPTPIPVKNSPATAAHLAATSDLAARYREQEITLDRDTLACLTQLAKDHRLTLNHVMQGAWASLLYRYSGETDVLFGATVSGRPADLPGVEQMVGLFINTLPLRLPIVPEQAFIDWLKSLQETQAELKHYEHSSLVDVQRCSQVPSKEALFESILVFENYPIDESLGRSQAALDVGALDAFQQTNFPLTLIAIPGEDLVLRFSFDSYLFSESTIGRMLGHLDNLLKGIANAPATPVQALPLLTATEHALLTHTWNDTARTIPARETLAEQFETQAERFAEQVAWQSATETVSYGELNRRANQWAHWLLAQGIKPEQPVAICLDRSLGMLTAMLAVLKAGGVYVPLDPNYPEDRLTYMLQDTAAPVIMTQSAYAQRFSFIQQMPVSLLVMDEQAALVGSQPSHNPGIRPPRGAESLAYIIYTSGSTGKPKGVCVPQVAVTRLVVNTNYVDIQHHHRIAHASNVSFDAATFEFWGALLNGATLVGVDKDTALNPAAFASYLKTQRIDILFLTTALFNVLSKHQADVFSGLTYLLFGGEACDPNQVRAVLEYPGGPEHLLHVYGPTENTTYATWYEVTDVLPGATTVPIGYPLANSTLYVLDDQRRPVPIGVPGEIYVGGVGIADGYLNRPELTADVFMADPFNPHYRLYRTGDLGRLLEDGALEILGRIDDQVKIRGFRIELGEIETALNTLDNVRESCVVVRADQGGNKQLIAYCEAAPEQSLTVADMRSRLKKLLPDYMVPAAFVMLDTLPITPNGKVDKRALPAPGHDAYLVADYVGPRNSVEQCLVDIWREVLALEQVGVHDDFFELGGHSLVVTKVASRIKDQLQVNLPLRTLFEVTTVAALAELIGAVTARADDTDEAEDWDDDDFDEGSL